MILTPLQLRLALHWLGEAVLPAAARASLDAWLARAAAGGSERSFGLSLDARLQCVTLRVDGEYAGMQSEIEHELGAGGALAEEAPRFLALAALFEPPRGGHWIEARHDSFDRGWSFACDAPLARARAAAPRTEKNDVLGAWADEHGIDRIARFACSVAAGNRFTELHVQLPSEGALDAALDAFDALSVPPPSSAVLETLWALERPAMRLTLWLTAAGVSRLGIIVPTPTTEEMVALCLASGVDRARLAPIAALEGTLGIDRCARIEWLMRAIGPTVELHYETPNPAASSATVPPVTPSV